MGRPSNSGLGLRSPNVERKKFMRFVELLINNLQESLAINKNVVERRFAVCSMTYLSSAIIRDVEIQT